MNTSFDTKRNSLHWSNEMNSLKQLINHFNFTVMEEGKYIIIRQIIEHQVPLKKPLISVWAHFLSSITTFRKYHASTKYHVKDEIHFSCENIYISYPNDQKNHNIKQIKLYSSHDYEKKICKPRRKHTFQSQLHHQKCKAFRTLLLKNNTNRWYIDILNKK